MYPEKEKIYLEAIYFLGGSFLGGGVMVKEFWWSKWLYPLRFIVPIFKFGGNTSRKKSWIVFGYIYI